MVLNGTAHVLIDGEERIVNTGESLFIEAKKRHRLMNQGTLPLEIIEVQMGDYVEEDDIVRFDDEYLRS